MEGKRLESKQREPKVSEGKIKKMNIYIYIYHLSSLIYISTFLFLSSLIILYISEERKRGEQNRTEKLRR